MGVADDSGRGAPDRPPTVVRWIEGARRHPAVVVVAAVLAVVTSVTTAWALLGDTADFVDDLANPHRDLYAQVDGLKLDVTPEYVDRALGPPAAVLTPEADCGDCGPLTVRLYPLGGDVVVRALFEGSTLRMYLVTRVDAEVRPTVRWQGSDLGSLGAATFAQASQLGGGVPVTPTDVALWPGAQRINYVEVFSLGAPGKYVGLILGHSSEGVSDMPFDLGGAQAVADAYSEPGRTLSDLAVEFRGASGPNTFGAFRDDGPVAALLGEAEFVNQVQSMGSYT